MIRARPCDEVVITPACEPVYERASYPRLWIAIASSAIEMRSPAVSSMSSSRPGGSGLTWWARSSSSSVVSPIAETTTTTSLPALRAATIRSATRLIRSASATEEPPYFCTISATARRPPSLRSGTFEPSVAAPSPARRDRRSHDPARSRGDNGGRGGTVSSTRATMTRCDPRVGGAVGTTARGRVESRRRLAAVAAPRAAAADRRPTRPRPPPPSGRPADRDQLAGLRRRGQGQAVRRDSTPSSSPDARRTGTVTVAVATDGTWVVDIPAGALGGTGRHRDRIGIGAAASSSARSVRPRRPPAAGRTCARGHAGCVRSTRSPPTYRPAGAAHVHRLDRRADRPGHRAVGGRRAAAGRARRAPASRSSPPPPRSRRRSTRASTATPRTACSPRPRSASARSRWPARSRRPAVGRPCPARW